MTASTEYSSLLNRIFNLDHKVLRLRDYQEQVRTRMRRGLCRERDLHGSSRKIKDLRNSSLERQIKREMLSNRYTFKVLLIEPFDNEHSIGLEAFELEHTRAIDGDLRLIYKSIIISIIYEAIRTILQEMAETAYLILADPKYQSYTQTLPVQLTILKPNSFPIEVAIAIAALWEIEPVKQVYHRCKEKIWWRESD